MRADQPATASGPREVFGRLRRVVLAYDTNGQADLYAFDGVLEWTFAPPGMPRRVEGREAIRNLLAPLGEQAQRSGRRPEMYDDVVIHETNDAEIVVEFDLVGTRRERRGLSSPVQPGLACAER